MAIIEQTKIWCDNEKIISTPQNEKVFFCLSFFCEKTFEHEVKGTG